VFVVGSHLTGGGHVGLPGGRIDGRARSRVPEQGRQVIARRNGTARQLQNADERVSLRVRLIDELRHVDAARVVRFEAAELVEHTCHAARREQLLDARAGTEPGSARQYAQLV
jgi:hypothetical protein